MKHKILTIFFVTTLMQNTSLLSSDMIKSLQQKENPKKNVKIARFLDHGLTFMQAYDAYESQFNLAQALTAAQNNKLKTFESYFKQRRESEKCSEDDAWFEEYSKKKEKSETKRYLEIAAAIKKDYAQTIIAAHFRSYKTRHNIKTGK